MDKLFRTTFYNGCNYLSILRFKSIQVRKREKRCLCYYILLTVYTTGPTSWHDAGFVVTALKRKCGHFDDFSRASIWQLSVQQFRQNDDISVSVWWHWLVYSWQPPMPPMTTKLVHDDVIKMKHFQRYYPFVRGNHRSAVGSPHKSQWRGAFEVNFLLNKRLNKQSRRRWFETPSRSLSPRCNDMSIDLRAKVVE